MQRLVKTLFPILLIALASILAFIVFPKFKSPPEKHVLDKKAMLVEAHVVERRSQRFVIESQGIVRPRTQTTLAAEVSGKVTNVADNFIAGGFLDKGEVLLEIDPSDYRVGVKLAEATLASRKAQFSSEKARSEQALKDWQRLHGNTSEANDLVLRLPQLAEAKANVSAAEADLERAQRNLERTRIRMPYAGMVREKRVDIGQFVSPGTPLGVTFAVDLVEIRLPVTSQELTYINLPEFSSSTTENLPIVYLSSNTKNEMNSWQARLVRSEGVVDEKSRQVYLVAQIKDPYGLLGESQQPPLAIGTFLSAKIEGKSVSDLFVIPRHSLADNNQVMVISADNTLEFRQVEVVRTTPKEIFIATGLSAGDRVISTAITAPIAGMAVRVDDDVVTEFDSEPAVETEAAYLEDVMHEFSNQEQAGEVFSEQIEDKAVDDAEQLSPVESESGDG